MDLEHRWEGRKRVNVAANLEHPVAGRVAGRIRDVSSGGVFVTTAGIELRQNQVIKLALRSRDERAAPPLRVQALVIWAAPGRAGLMFCESDETTSQVLRTLLGDKKAGADRGAVLPVCRASDALVPPLGENLSAL